MNNNKEQCYEPVCEKEDILTFKRTKKSKLQFQDSPEEECPLGRNTVGYYTWGFLHTAAIYYPDNPSTQQQEKMLSFIDGLAEFYPCTHCRTHFNKEILKNPPKVQSRKDLSIWYCEQHNEVNKMLGKKQFNCDFDHLEKRWRTGCK